MTRLSWFVVLLATFCAVGSVHSAGQTAQKPHSPQFLAEVAFRCAEAHVAIGNPQWDIRTKRPHHRIAWDELVLMRIPRFPLYVVDFVKTGRHVGGDRSTCFFDDSNNQVVLVRYTYADPGEHEVEIRPHEAISRLTCESTIELFEDMVAYRYKLNWDWFIPD